MKWRGRAGSSNIEDRRGAGGGIGGGFRGGLGGGGFGFPRGGTRIPIPMGRRSGGLGGIGLIIAIVIIGMVLGINPLDMLTGGSTDGSTVPSSTSNYAPPTTNADEQDLTEFVSVVVKETEDLWTEVFAKSGSSYDPPKVVLFTAQTNSGCGVADAATGPFYCPVDQKVYIDLSFYDQLRQQFGAPGDFAQAYVIAHEVGHHVQNLTGVLPQFNQARQSMSETEANAYSVRVELQADCYAGVWANYVGEENILDDGDVQEALNAADKIGDDTLQKRMQGYAVPKTFNHGTSAQRQHWFERGYENGNPGACDTFSPQQV